MESYDPIASRVPSGFQSNDVKSPCPAFDTFSIISGSPGTSAKNSDLGDGSGRSQRLTVPSFDLVQSAASVLKDANSKLILTLTPTNCAFLD
jgi:hypothetical protein